MSSCRAEWRQRGADATAGAARVTNGVWQAGKRQAGKVSGQAARVFRSFRTGSVRNVTDGTAVRGRRSSWCPDGRGLTARHPTATLAFSRGVSPGDAMLASQ